MKVKLKRIPPLAAAKVTAIIYSCFSLIFVPIMIIGAVAGAMSPAEGSGVAAGAGIAMMILMPVFYIAGGFLMTLIGCAIYNLVAGWVGGIELEFETMETEA